MSDDLLQDMAADTDKANSPSLYSDKLGHVAALVKKFDELDLEVAKLEDLLRQAKKNRDQVQGIDLPDLFDELGLKQIKLPNGASVEISQFFAANVSEANREKAFTWLREHGHGAIIKHDVTINVKKGEEKKYQKLVSDLLKTGMTFSDKEKVHPQTLAAFVKEQMGAEGVDFPTDLFGVFPVRKAKIKK